MRMDLDKFTVESSHDFENHMFGIGDERVVLEILRNRMYSNPIRIICQEICSNARDANREVGKFDIPIEVHFPTDIDPHYRVRDYGPSVTKDRMATVFVKYGNSTKRDSNLETGGFGLGAKTPFSYSDTFSVVSITSEDNPAGPDDSKVNIKRTWAAVIDETGYGQMNLMSENTTEEEQGTEVIVPVKPGDSNRFREWTQKMARFWKVKPRIIEYDEEITDFFEEESEISLSSDDHRWHICQQNRNQENAAIAILDGIPYRIQFASLKLPDEDDSSAYSYNNLADLPVRMLFKTGEITITANREDLDYKQKTITAIRKVLDEIISSIKKKVQEQVEQQPNYTNAVSAWAELYKSYGRIIKKVTWQGHEVLSSALKPFDHLEHNEREKCKSYTCRRSSGSIFEFTCSTDEYSPSIAFRKDILVAFDDSGNKRPSRPKMARMFEDNPEARSIVILNLGEDQDKQDLQDKIRNKTMINLLQPYFLKDVKPLSRTRENSGGKKQFIQAYKSVKLTSYSRRRRRPNDWQEMRNFNLDGKGVYVKYTGTSGAELANGRMVDGNTLYQLRHELGMSIYAFSARMLKKIGKRWIPLEDYVRKQVEVYKSSLTINNIKYKDIQHLTFDDVQVVLEEPVFVHTLGSDHPLSKLIRMFKQSRMNKKEEEIFGCRINFIEHLDQIGRADDEDDEDNEDKEEVKDPMELRIEELAEEKKSLLEKYPLLESVEYKGSNYYYSTREKKEGKKKLILLSKEVAFYILSKDVQIEKETLVESEKSANKEKTDANDGN